MGPNLSPLPCPYRTVPCPYRTVPCPYRVRTVPYRVRTVPHRVRTVPYRVRTVPFSVFFTVPFFTASATVNVPFFCLTVRSAKRTEPLILTVRFLVSGNRYTLVNGDREPYRTNMGIINRLVLRTANRTAPNGGPLSVYYWGSRSVPHQN